MCICVKPKNGHLKPKTESDQICIVDKCHRAIGRPQTWTWTAYNQLIVYRWLNGNDPDYDKNG